MFQSSDPSITFLEIEMLLFYVCDVTPDLNFLLPDEKPATEFLENERLRSICIQLPDHCVQLCLLS